MPQERSWKNLLIASFVAMLPLFIVGVITLVSFKSVADEKFRNISEQLNEVPTNEIMLQWMDATKKEFMHQHEILESHISGDKEKWDRQYNDYKEVKDMIKRIEDKYLVPVNRSKTKDKTSYIELNNFLWENNRPDFLCEMLVSRKQLIK